MKISAFTLVRNGLKFDYPFIESMRSLLPLVDELIVNVGYGEDDSRKRVEQFACEEGAGKVRFFDSEWPLEDPEKRRGGQILSQQTNLALDRCTGDWCIYLQADEVFHEADYPALLGSLRKADKNLEVEGLVFDYVHFYGSYGVMQQSRSAYRREVRAIRRASGARSVGDAQSFRKPDGSKIRVDWSHARVFHYGWVRTPAAMREKTFFMDTLYHGKSEAKDSTSGIPFTGDNYLYKKIWGLTHFKGSHPKVMADRIEKKSWNWDIDRSPLVWSWKDLSKMFLDWVERITGRRFFEYRSYKITAGRSRNK